MGNGNKKKKNNALFVIIILICASVMAFSLYKLVSITRNYNMARDEYDALRQYVSQNDEFGNGAGSGTGGNEYYDENGEDASNGGRNASAGRTGEGQDDGEDAANGGRNATSGRNGSEKDEDVDENGNPRKGGSATGIDRRYRKLEAPISVDHKALLAGNPDYRGWIYIEALPNISYPIMQSTDNDYYLHRTYERADLFAGSIFLDYQSSGDFTDMNTLVYGHNMKDDSMFGILQSIMDDALYRVSPYFWILTPNGNYKYKMFSMFSTDVYSEAYILHKYPNQAFVDWIGKMKSISMVDMGEMEYDEDSLVVTLSTCISGQGPDRFLILGIRVYE